MAVTVKMLEVQNEYERVSEYWGSFLEYKDFRLKRLAESGHYVYYDDHQDQDQPIEPVNHWEDLKEYEVWMEGHIATGDRSNAHLWGKAKARNFAEACHKVACANYLKNIKKDEVDPKMQYGLGRWDYDPASLTYWGCNLFDNEKDARRAFG